MSRMLVVVRRALACVVLAGCAPYYPPPDVPRTCSAEQTHESLDCAQYGFEVRVRRDYPADEELLRNGARTACGCLQNLASTVDAAAREHLASEVVEGCRCIRDR